MRALVLCATLRPTGCKLSLSDCGRSSPSGRPFGRQRPRRKNVRGLAKFSLWPQRSAQKREDDHLTHTLCRCEKIVLQRRVVGAIRRLADGCPRAATRAARATRFFRSFLSPRVQQSRAFSGWTGPAKNTLWVPRKSSLAIEDVPNSPIPKTGETRVDGFQFRRTSASVGTIFSL